MTAPAFRWKGEHVKAGNVTDDDILADGAVILRMSFQLNWIYATCAKNGRVTRRRWRWDQLVAIQTAIPEERTP